MLQVSNTLMNQPVLSLRTGREVAVTAQPIINPNNLKIEGFYCQDSVDKRHVLVLLEQDIREMIGQGLVIDDYDVLSEPDDLIRLKEVLDTGFDPIGKPVITVSKAKIGKVNDYAVELPSFFIKKLYVSRSILKSLGSAHLSIDRTQIVEITAKKIVVQDPLEPARAGMPAGLPAS